MILSDKKKDFDITQVKGKAYSEMKDAHYHPYYEFYYLLSGTRRIFINDTIYYVKKGDLIVIPKGELHRTTYIGGQKQEPQPKQGTASSKALDPLRRMETKVVPLAPVGEPAAIYASLNGKGYLIPRGKPVTMPEAVWEVVERMLAAERIQEEELRRNQ